MDLDALVDRALRLARAPGRAVLGIAGSPGAGKSTLAAYLLKRLGEVLPPDAVAHVPMDGFHLADVVLTRLGLWAAKGAPDTFDVGGYVALLRRLRARPPEEVIYAPAFERDLEQPLAGAIAVRPTARLVLTEGNYLLLGTGRWREVRPLLDEVWFCEPEPRTRMSRLVARHIAFGKAPAAADAWVTRVDEPNAALVETTRGRADLLLGPPVLERVPLD